jgi:glucose/arabinose dehydrogenase
MRSRLQVAALCVLLAGGGALAQTRPAAPAEDQLFRPGGRAGFLVDAESGCWLWVSGIAATATELRARWSGACPEGPATGPGRAQFTWREGQVERAMIHDGTMRGGKSEGRGTLAHLRDGEAVAVESGDYADDLLVQGRVELPQQGVAYEGPLARGMLPQGRGKLTVRGQAFEGDWQQGCLALPGGAWIAFGRNANTCQEQES